MTSKDKTYSILRVFLTVSTLKMLTIVVNVIIIVIINFKLLCQLHITLIFIEFPRWCIGKEAACQCRRHKRHGFDPWIRKIPWSKKWPRSPVFLPGKSHGQRSLVGYSPRGHKESDMTKHIHATHKIFICLQKSIYLSALYVIESDKKSAKDCVPELIGN